MKFIAFVFILSFFLSCNKPDPNPENSDEVYKDLLQELDIATKGFEAEKKNLEKLKSELDKSVPQTGQVKFAQKKVYESQATVDKLAQQKQFFEVKIELRKAYVRERYMEARRGGKKWPEPGEIENYRAMMKLQRDKLEWGKNKGQKKEASHANKEGGAHGESAPAAENSHH